MPEFTVTDPSGKQYKVTAPEGATQAQIIAKAREFAASPPKEPASFFGGLGKGLRGGLASFIAAQAGSDPEGQGGLGRADIEAMEREFVPAPPEGLKGRVGYGIGEALGNPLSYVGPAGAARTAARVGSNVAGAIGSELTGMVTNDNPLARMAGGIAGSVAPRGVAKAISPARPLLPRKEAPLTRLRAAGVEPMAGDVTGSNAVRQAERLGERAFGGNSYQEAKTRVTGQFTRAASRMMGENAEYLDESVFRQAEARIGRTFQRVARILHIPFDHALDQEFESLERQMIAFGYPDDEIRRIQKMIEHIQGGFRPGVGARSVGTNTPVAWRMSGDTYQGITRHGEELQRMIAGDNPTLSYYATRIRSALDDSMERGATTRGTRTGTGRRQALADLREARAQWYNMMVLKESVAGRGEAAAQGLVTPERLAARLTATGDNKLAYVSSRANPGLRSLARAGEAIMAPWRASTSFEMGGAHAVGAGAGFALGHGVGALAGAVAPGPVGRVINSRAVQAYLKNRAARHALTQIPPLRELIARGAASGLPGTYAGQVVQPQSLKGIRPGDRRKDDERPD